MQYPSGATPAWLQHNIVGGVLSIDGTPDLDIKVEQSFPYSYSLGGNFFGCGVASATVSGKITLRPKDHLTLFSDPQTINQDICINEEIIDIVYEFSGSANAMAFNQPLGLPDGVEGQYTPRQQVSEITIGNGITGIISETYTVYIGSTPYVYIAPLGTNADTVGDELAQKIDGDSDVSAIYDGATNKITVTAAVAGQSFGIFVPDQSSNSIEINDPLVATSPGIFRISGAPSNAVTPGSYTYTLTTPGILCDSDTAVGTINVKANSTISLVASNTNNQTVCDGEDLVSMVFNIGGGAKGAIYTGILPEGLDIYLDDPNNPTTATISGTLNTGDSATNIYDFTIITTSNADGCDEASVNATIIVDPKDSLTLTSANQTTNQEVCAESPITDITYEIGGNANSVDIVGLPPGVVEGPMIERKQVTSILVTGPVINANQVYTIRINNTSHTVTSTGGETQGALLTLLLNKINAESTVVSATSNAQNLILTGVVSGVSFSVSKERSPNAMAQLHNPVLQNGTKIITLTGTPTLSALTSGVSSKTWPITVTTVSGGLCENQTEIVSIKVNPNSTVSVTSVSSTLNQPVCVDTSIASITFTIGGGASNAALIGNPQGIQLTRTPGTDNFTIHGKPEVNIVTPTTYTMTITTIGNQEGCQEETVSAILNVSPDDGIQLAAGSGQLIQTHCVSTDIETITFDLTGGSNTAEVTGLPQGIKTTLNAASRTFSLSGMSTEIVTQTTEYNYTVTTSGSCDPSILNGKITIVPNATVTVTSVSTTLDQTICDNTDFDAVTFEVDGSFTDISFQIDPALPGFTPVFDINTGIGSLSGKPNTGIVSTTTYSYTISVIGDANSCETGSFTGELTLLPNDQITHIGASGAKDQIICNGDTPAPGPSITPIVFQISGGGDFAIAEGLPNGLTQSYSSTTKRITIAGSPSLSITQTTEFNYTVRTNGLCSEMNETGKITVKPNSFITLTSSATTESQINLRAVCNNGDSIVPITYSIGGGTFAFEESGLPDGIEAQSTGVGEITISGTPDTNDTEITIYTYVISSTGNECGPETSVTGQIQVNPTPSFSNKDAITIDNITCFGLANGKITVPNDINAFLSGGQSTNQAEINTLTISGTFEQGDRLSVTLGPAPAVTYEYIVKNANFGNPAPENNNKIAENFAQIINANIGGEVPITASSAGAVITLTADTAGVPFDVTLNHGGDGVQSAQNGEIVAQTTTPNQTLNYSLSWTGPGGFTSASSNIENLEVGKYYLTVALTGGCTSTTEEFEVTEPTQLSIPQPSACGTTITAQASGGTPNYSYTLRNLTTNQSYPSNLGAIPGAVVFDSTGKVQVGELFRVDAIDANGCVVQSIGNTMPGALEITDANVKVVNDYCNENPDIGFGSIILDSGGQLAVSGGSNNYTYSWSGPNGYTNSTMNINNLVPGVYNLTVTDNVFANCIVQNSYTVLGSDPLDLAPTAGNAPNAVTGVSTNTAVDQKVTLNCNSTALVLEVQASGGINNNYIYNWDRNGTAIGGNGNQLTVDPPVSGIYNVEVSLDISALDPPFGYSQNDLICTKSYSFEVVIPAEMSVVEDTNKRIVPACPGDFAQLVFNVNGGADGSGPYTVKFDNGLSGTSAGPSNREIIITGIDTSNHNTFSGYTISGGDPSCTRAGALPSQITLPNYNEIDIQATPQDIDCSTSQEGKIEFSYNGNPDLNTLSIQIKSPVLNYNYFNTWQNLSSGAGNATVDIDQAGTYEYTIFGTPVSGATSNTNICELDSGTVEVLDSANSQILLLAVNAQDPPCDEDTGGSIELVIDETTITPQMSIKWQKLTLSTSTVSASTSSLSTATTEITTQDWQYVPSLEGNLSVQNLVKGSYRAIIRSNNEGNCANNEITTSTQVIGGRGFELLNLRYLDAPAADSSVSECSVDNIRYNIEFTLANEKINGGNIEITVNKTGGRWSWIF